MKRTVGMAAVALFIASSASAQPGNLEKAARILEQQARAGRGEFITYLVGAAAGYRWASKETDGGMAGLYCPPANARFDGKAWGKIALEEYRRDKPRYASLDGEYPLSVFALALLHGLQSSFPCPSEDAGPDESGTEPEPIHGTAE